MQGLETFYLGPTNNLGSRIKVRTTGEKPRQMTFPYDAAKSTEKNHIDAAREFALKLGWHGLWYSCGTNRGCIFVRVLDIMSPDFVTF